MPSDQCQLGFGRVAGNARTSDKDREDVTDEPNIPSLRANEDDKVVSISGCNTPDVTVAVAVQLQ
jgi:hypothetical protein